jgi:flagellar biogenesis protein FliO
MRVFIAWIACVGGMLAPSLAAAQQVAVSAPPDLLVSPRLTPLVADEPRSFSPPTSIEARQIPSAFPSPRSLVNPEAATRRPQPPVNFRLASAQENIDPEGAKPPLRLAPRSQAARQAVSRPVPPSAGTAIGTVAASLGVVLGLFLMVVWCTRRFTPGGAALLPKEAVELLGRAPLAGRQQMQLVRIGNKLLLFALSPVGVAALTEITDATEVEHLTALCRRGQPGSSAAAFQQALTQLGNEKTERSFVGSPRPTSRGGQ